jgi:hypothetical protein
MMPEVHTSYTYSTKRRDVFYGQLLYHNVTVPRIGMRLWICLHKGHARIVDAVACATVALRELETAGFVVNLTQRPFSNGPGYQAEVRPPGDPAWVVGALQLLKHGEGEDL